ncbi:MAG: type I-B CRISPR-associated protein Cas7/Csh2 [Candidatus Helarchaeota archaeon]
MVDQIKNRSEIVFFYDIRDCNPNGDPLAENRPRIDEECGVCYVTDVRLKRTIRDYLRDYKKEVILIDEFEKDDGTIKMASDRAKDFGVDDKTKNPQDKILASCIDARLFGAAIPLGTGVKSIQVTGPVQFNYGRSVHEVGEVFLQGTAAFASQKGAHQRSFREDYILHYALIKFYGIINEHLAAISKATVEDRNKLLEAIWHGTNALQSRSKVGHLSRLLIVVHYKENDNFLIGQIDKLIKVKKIDDSTPDKSIRGIEEFQFDVTPLLDLLQKYKDRIACIEWKVHDGVIFKDTKSLKELFEGIGIDNTELID